MAKLMAAKCPTCGAGITVPPGAAQIACRYCGNTISVEMRKGPASSPIGTPGAVPSRTLYLDPDAAAAAGKSVAAMVVVGIAVSLIAAAVGVGFAFRSTGAAASVGGARKASYPATCGLNETIELSGDWEGSGPAITDVSANCKIKIGKGHVKAQRLLESAGVNTEITLTDVVLETSLTAIGGGTNTKVHVTGGSISSGDDVVTASGPNLEVTLTNTKLAAIGGHAVASSINLTLTATGSTIGSRKAAAIVADTNAKLKLRETDVTAMGSAIRAKSNCTLDATGGSIASESSAAIAVDANGKLAFHETRVRGIAAAVEATGNLDLAADGATFDAAKGAAIQAATNAKVVVHGGAVRGTPATSFTAKPAVLDLEGSKVEGNQKLAR